MTTSTGPAMASRSAAARASTSSWNGTTTDAPASRARPAAASLRQTATTWPAPSASAAPIADWPTAPPPPSTTTRSPGRKPARQVRHIQPATAESPSAARAASSIPASTGTRSASATEHNCASEPSPASHPRRGREPHPLPGQAAAPDPLHAGDIRRRRPPEVGRTRSAQHVQRHDRGGRHPHQRPARQVGRLRILPDDRRRTGLGQDCRAHVRWKCRDRAATGGPSPRRTPAGTPAVRGRARTAR